MYRVLHQKLSKNVKNPTGIPRIHEFALLSDDPELFYTSQELFFPGLEIFG
jgi:hypothetical protein